jgi:fermentation-respiration switch protein FrsA (DUF1100 family)
MKLPVVALAALFSLLLAGCVSPPAAYDQFYVGSDNLLAVSADRGPLEVTQTPVESADANFSVTKIVFTSADGSKVYALLDIPLQNGKPVRKAPAAVFMPGLGVSKEGGNVGVGKALADAGFVVIVLDQRGVGETGGTSLSLNADYAEFAAGNYSSQHLMVFDYLRAFDYLALRPEVDAGKIVFTGESHGGRVAIMAGALEPKARGALVISTAGYEFISPPVEAQQYLASVNPDAYVGKLTPRKIVFLHSPNDKGVPMADARRTFSYADEPKEFIEIACEFHGYCTQVSGTVVQKAGELAAN